MEDEVFSSYGNQADNIYISVKTLNFNIEKFGTLTEI